jgi:hypothetical protein
LRNLSSCNTSISSSLIPLLSFIAPPSSNS